jgi:hypothetical protein
MDVLSTPINLKRISPRPEQGFAVRGKSLLLCLRRGPHCGSCPLSFPLAKSPWLLIVHQLVILVSILSQSFPAPSFRVPPDRPPLAGAYSHQSKNPKTRSAARVPAFQMGAPKHQQVIPFVASTWTEDSGVVTAVEVRQAPAVLPVIDAGDPTISM